MKVETRLSGLNELLTVIYGNDMQLVNLLLELGFEQSQVEQLQNGNLEMVITRFLEVIHKRLTSDAGKDTYYQILSRRYGLDGEPRKQLSAIAETYGFAPGYLHQLFEEILGRCKSKTWQKELRTGLKHIAVEELGKMKARPAREYVSAKLERLSNLRAAADLARLDYEFKRTVILKQIQFELDALDAEYKPVLEAAETNLATLENEIKTDVLLYGESISGGTYRATYNHGRVSWDNDGMAKYAAFHPDVLQYRKQGQPIVSLRVVNKE